MEIFLHQSSSLLFKTCKNVTEYLFLYLVDGEYGFLDLILLLVNHFRPLNYAAPSSFIAGTLINHACNRVLTRKVKNLPLHNFLLLHSRSQLKNSCFVFHQGFQHLEKIKALRLRRRAFIFFSVFGSPEEKLALVFDLLLPCSLIPLQARWLLIFPGRFVFS